MATPKKPKKRDRVAVAEDLTTLLTDLEMTMRSHRDLLSEEMRLSRPLLEAYSAAHTKLEDMS